MSNLLNTITLSQSKSIHVETDMNWTISWSFDGHQKEHSVLSQRSFKRAICQDKTEIAHYNDLIRISRIKRGIKSIHVCKCIAIQNVKDYDRVSELNFLRKDDGR